MINHCIIYEFRHHLHSEYLNFAVNKDYIHTMKQNSYQAAKHKNKTKERVEESNIKRKVKKHKKGVSQTTKVKEEIPKHHHKETFQDVISKFKKLFDDKITFMKDESCPETERYAKAKKKAKLESSKSFQNQKDKSSRNLISKKKPKEFTEIFSTMEQKLNKHHVNSRSNIQDKKNWEKPLKSKSREKSRTKSITKPGSTLKKIPKEKKGKPKIQEMTKRINTIFSQNEKVTQRMTNEDLPEEDSSKSNGSVIIYNINEDEDELFFERPSQHEKSPEKNIKQSIAILETYLLGLWNYRAYQRQKKVEQEKKKSVSILDSPRIGIEKDSQLNLEEMFREQQGKWLRLKESLLKVKNGGNLSGEIDLIIEEAENNHMALKSMEIKEGKSQRESSEKKQLVVSQLEVRNDSSSSSSEVQEVHQFCVAEEPKPHKKTKLNYEEAPLQIKKIFKEKRKSIEEVSKEEELKSKEISIKSLKEDIELMEFMSNGSSHQEQERKKIKIQLSEEIGKKGQEKKNKNIFSLFRKDKNHSEENLVKETPPLSEWKKSSHEELVMDGYHKKKSDSRSDTLLLNDFSPHQPESKEELEEANESKSSNLTEKLKQLEDIIALPTMEEYHPGTPTNVEAAQNRKANRQEEEPDEEDHGCPFVRSASNTRFLEEYGLTLFEQLVEQMVWEMTPLIKVQLNEYYNAENIEIFEGDINMVDVYEHEERIECSATTCLLITHNMLNFMRNLPNNELLKRINKPLGLKSEEMLALLRKIKYGENDSDSELGDSNYHSIIDVDHICDFEIENQNNNCYEQFFNQAVFDVMNNILDEMRPYGKHGYPPICFKHDFALPSFDKVSTTVMRKVTEITAVKLGLMHFELDSERVIRESLDAFTQGCVNELEQEWQWQKQGQFELYLQLMNEFEQIIFYEEAMQIAFAFKK